MSDVDPTPDTPTTVGDRLGWWRSDTNARMDALSQQLANQHAEMLAALDALAAVAALATPATNQQSANQHAEMLAALDAQTTSIDQISSKMGQPTGDATTTVLGLLSSIQYAVTGINGTIGTRADCDLDLSMMGLLCKLNTSLVGQQPAAPATPPPTTCPGFEDKPYYQIPSWQQLVSQSGPAMGIFYANLSNIHTDMSITPGTILRFENDPLTVIPTFQINNAEPTVFCFSIDQRDGKSYSIYAYGFGPTVQESFYAHIDTTSGNTDSASVTLNPGYTYAIKSNYGDIEEPTSQIWITNGSWTDPTGDGWSSGGGGGGGTWGEDGTAGIGAISAWIYDRIENLAPKVDRIVDRVADGAGNIADNVVDLAENTADLVQNKLQLVLDRLDQIISNPNGHVHNQSSAATQWVINHNLGRSPGCFVIDNSGNIVEFDRTDPDFDTTILTFSSATSGKAVCS